MKQKTANSKLRCRCHRQQQQNQRAAALHYNYGWLLQLQQKTSQPVTKSHTHTLSHTYSQHIIVCMYLDRVAAVFLQLEAARAFDIVATLTPNVG